MKRVYNKLVRDNIPDICLKNNETPVTRILDENEYISALKIKLQEEVNEFIESDDITELADILEVVDALAAVGNSSLDRVLEIKNKKADANGKFDKRIFLLEVEGK